MRNSWKTSRREAAVEVFISLCSQFPEISMNVVLQLVQFYFEIRSVEKQQTFDAICQQESLLRMISISSNLLKSKINFEIIWQNILTPLFIQQSNYLSIYFFFCFFFFFNNIIKNNI